MAGKLRAQIEMTFGILKRRWAHLSAGLRVDDPLLASSIIQAAAILHNFISRQLGPGEQDIDVEFDENQQKLFEGIDQEICQILIENPDNDDFQNRLHAQILAFINCNNLNVNIADVI
jgi:hypothetical protein